MELTKRQREYVRRVESNIPKDGYLTAGDDETCEDCPNEFSSWPYHLRRCQNRAQAAIALLADLPSKTPDGVPYTYTTVRAALRGLS